MAIGAFLSASLCWTDAQLMLRSRSSASVVGDHETLPSLPPPWMQSSQWSNAPYAEGAGSVPNAEAVFGSRTN